VIFGLAGRWERFQLGAAGAGAWSPGVFSPKFLHVCARFLNAQRCAAARVLAKNLVALALFSLRERRKILEAQRCAAARVLAKNLVALALFSLRERKKNFERESRRGRELKKFFEKS
jgi:hypothetical protein